MIGFVVKLKTDTCSTYSYLYDVYKTFYKLFGFNIVLCTLYYYNMCTTIMYAFRNNVKAYARS